MKFDLLTDESVRNLYPPGSADICSTADGGPDLNGTQLFLFAWRGGNKNWKLRYIFDGKKKWLILGDYPLMSLSGARLAAMSCKEILASGIDPEEFFKQLRDGAIYNNRFWLSEGVLEKLKCRTLFYPCSGKDLIDPIKIFSPFVNEFWFVDRGYFVPGNQDTRRYGMDAPADRQAPVLESKDDYRLIDVKISGSPSWNIRNPDIEPCILTEKYVHVPSQEVVLIHRRRGYGFSAFRKEIDSLGVFFYRGDSLWEGGSGNLWLAPDRVVEICSKLVDGGLIVTDGCQHGEWTSRKYGNYKNFSKWQSKSSRGDLKDFVESIDPFTDKCGQKFECVGFAGKDTLAWQVTKPEA